MKRDFLKKILFVFGMALIALLAFVNFSLAFLGPTNYAGVGGGLLIASSSGALLVTTSTFGTSQSQFLVKTALPGQWIIFNPNGTVGIATVSSSATLSVGGDIQATTFRGDGSNLSSLRPSNIVGGAFGGGSNYAFPLGLSVGTSTVVGIPDIFYVVGRAEIYNPSDTGRLTIKGINMSSSTDPDSAELILEDSKSGQTWDLENRGTADNEFRLESWDQITRRVPFKVASTSPTNSLVIASSGYVGIGTYSPQWPLHVNGPSVPGPAILISNPASDSDSHLRFTEGGNTIGASIEYKGNADQLRFADLVSGNAKLVWERITGRLGVGTISPAYLVDVVGDINLNSTSSYRRGGTAGISVSCPSGQVLATTTVSGGIITGGSCVSLSGGGNISGSGTSSQVSFFTGANTISSDSNLYWDNTNTTLSIGSSGGGANRGRICQWNGTNYTLTSFAANSIVPIYSTSTTCL